MIWGKGWREGIDGRRRAKRKLKEERAEEAELEKGVVLPVIVESRKGKEKV